MDRSVRAVRRLARSVRRLSTQLRPHRDLSAVVASAGAALPSLPDGALPSAFDPNYYRSVHRDLHGLDLDRATQHWLEFGIAEGRVGSAAATRRGFEALLADAPSILEIGPLDAPIVRGDHVSYFDIGPTARMREVAASLDRDPDGCPEITYHSPKGDLSVVTERFARVVSSHAIEHQPDLVGHLQAVARLLEPGGRYFLVVPDQRYCFDHFLTPSTIAEVLGAHAQGAELHAAANVINTHAMGAHNDPVRHWAGDHGRAAYLDHPELLMDGFRLCVDNPDTYLDTHAWRFTPATFRSIMSTLYELGLSPFRPARVYETVRDNLEFYAILELVGTATDQAD